MKRQILLVSLALVSLGLGRPSRALAHRLDEYLQATRVAIDRDRASLEIDLTPGVDVAPELVRRIDTNKDGEISTSEGESYAKEVVRALALSVDVAVVQAVLIDQRFPSVQEMTSGIGVIRLRVTAQLPSTSAGNHELSYKNGHQPVNSVYLANALVPSDSRIQISGQRRDFAQHELAVEYRVLPDSKAWLPVWLMAGLTLAGIYGIYRRRTLTKEE